MLVVFQKCDDIYDDFTNYLSSLNHEFSIIALSETWLTDSTEMLYDIPLYKAVHCCRPRRTGGGVSIYVHTSLQFCVREDLAHELKNIDVEALFIEITSCSFFSGRNVIIGCVYRPPDTDSVSFNDTLGTILEMINTERKLCFLLGDFNLDLFKCETQARTSDFLNILFSCSFYPLINKPTRVTKSSATLIDNIFTNSVNNTTKSGILFTDISDHFPIFHFSISDKTGPVGPGNVRRLFNRQNTERFKKLIDDISWDNVYKHTDAESAYQTFVTTFNSAFHLCFPLVQLKKNLAVLNKKPWYTSGLHKSSTTKNKLYKRFLTNPTPLNSKKYKTYRNKYNHLIRIAKKIYFSNKLKEYSTDIRSTWKVINQLMNKQKSSVSHPSEFNEGGVTFTDPYVISCEFNNFFAQVGSSLSKNIKPSNRNPLDYIKGNFPPLLQLENTDIAEVMEIIGRLKTSAPGHDDICASLIKSVSSFIVEPLTYIFNLSLQTGCVPKDLKIAKVIPLHKTGDTRSFNNYRPISILPCFSKILEKLVQKRILSHLNKHSILHEHQYGFRENHSTDMALLQLVEKIYTAINNNKYALGIFLDLSKAFDSVDHTILLSKLHRYGFHDISYIWLVNYVSNREQFVYVNGCTSSRAQLTYGVPQGSILGPLLFLVYINDLATVSSTMLPILFADDTNLILTHSHFDSLISEANSGIIKFSEWFQINKLTLNVKKTNFIIFTGKNKKYCKSSAKITIGDNDIIQVSSTKFLGVLIDERLSWSEHIKLVNNKVLKSIGIIRKIRDFISQEVLNILYYSLIHPHLSYGNIVWASTYPSNLQKLLIAQKKFVRLATFSNYLSPSAPLFKNLQIMSVYDINILQSCVFTYKYIQLSHLLPKSFHEFFTVNSQVHSYNTRQTDKLHPPFCRTTHTQFSFAHRGSILWNSHLHVVKLSSSLNTFKLRLKAYLLNQSS